MRFFTSLTIIATIWASILFAGATADSNGGVAKLVQSVADQVNPSNGDGILGLPNAAIGDPTLLSVDLINIDLKK